MTEVEIDDIYDRLSEMRVPVEHDPSLGPVYFAERVARSRALQDEVTDLLVRVNRAWSTAKLDILKQKAIVKLATAENSAMEKRRLEELQEVAERLKYLREAVNVCKANLVRTASDVRVLLDAIKIGLAAAGIPLDRPAAPASPPVPDIPADAATAGDLDRFYAGESAPEGILEGTPNNLDDLFD